MSIRSDIRTVLAAKGKPRRMARPQRVSAINEALSAVEKYGKGNAGIRAMLRNKTQLARFLSTVAGIFGNKRSMGKNAIDAAVRILLAAGFGVTPGPSEARAGRGEEKGVSPTQGPPPPFSSTGPRTRPPPLPTTDDPVLAEVVGGGEAIDPQAASRARQEAAEVHIVSSSNVHSFYYVRTGRTGTLYVTFLAWTPGSKTREGPGATYAYFDVPVQKYLKFKNKSRLSPGRAVWAYLRVLGKGNRARHQHQYTLTRVAALGVRDLEAYVPRKITRTGFRTRNLPDLSGRSQLRPKTFVVAGNRPKAVVSGGRRSFV